MVSRRDADNAALDDAILNVLQHGPATERSMARTLDESLRAVGNSLNRLLIRRQVRIAGNGITKVRFELGEPRPTTYTFEEQEQMQRV